MSPVNRPFDSILAVENLHVERGDVRILRGVSWTVNKGEHWVILGPNGCGKTSLLTALTAYLTPSRGRIVLLGETYGQADWNELRQRIGMVSTALAVRVPPEELALETVLSGESAQLGFWSRNPEEHTQKALRCMGQLRVRHLADRRWGLLSQGERQRVFIARALMADPALLILDEPCAGLDPVARERFLENIGRLARSRRGPSIVLVTHHVEEIIPEMTHALLLKSGRVEASGRVRDVLTYTNVGKTFGANVCVTRSRQKRWSLRLKTPGS